MILRDALQEMNQEDRFGNRRTFDIEYVTADRKRKTGGEIRSISGVRKVGSTFNQKENQMINVQVPGNTRHPYPVHIRLILKYNGNPIYW